MYYCIREAILRNHILHIFVWLYLVNTHHFQLLIDIFIRLNCMVYVHCGDNSKCQNVLVNTIISDKPMATVSFEIHLRSCAICLYYVVCHFILSQFETPPEATYCCFE